MNLASAILDTARCLGQANIIGTVIATDGNTNIIDTKLKEPSNTLINGTLIMLTGDAAGKTIPITANDQTAYKISFANISPLVIDYGDQYVIIPPKYTRTALLEGINTALRYLGGVLQANTTMVTVADQEQYDLPAGVYNLKRVEFSRDTTTPFKYMPPHHWWIEWEGKLVLSAHKPQTDGLGIRIWYEAPHADVRYDTDTITDAIYPMRLAWTAAFFAAMTRAGLAENAEPNTKETREIASQMRILESRHPIRSIARDPRWSRFA